MAKEPKSIAQQIELLTERGMLFQHPENAQHFLENISYYRLKGYWWEMQSDKENHIFASNTFFEKVIELYNFDRNLRRLLFNAIERIEIALRTRLIYYMSLDFGPHWFVQQHLFKKEILHSHFLSKIDREMKNSSEEFMIQHYKNHRSEIPEAWKALEVVTLNTLSKVYANIKSQLPAKSNITNSFGMYSTKVLSSWFLTITHIRNIIAHHSRLWNRVFMNPPQWPKSTPAALLNYQPETIRLQKLFPILCAMLYLNDIVSPGHHIKDELLELIKKYPSVELYRMGFPPDWNEQPIFKT